jgi:hypothetical protein
MALRSSLLLVVVVALAQLGFAASAGAYDEPSYSIAPNVNDAGIVDTVPTRGQNLVWLPRPERRVDKLLVFLPTGGLTNLPTEFKNFGTEASRLGYPTIILAYRNEAPIAAAPTATPPGCGNGAEPSSAPPNCAIDIRMELLDGRGESTVVDVDRANSIENRLNKLLEYLAASPEHAGEGWAQFLDTSGPEPAPKWSQIVIAGSSLGAGEAAIIASQHVVHRVALLHGWTDAKHGWVALGATPANRYFALIHARDTFFARTCYAYLALGLAPSCPLPGFTIPPAAVDPTNPLFVENRQPPFATPLHVFDLEPGSFAGTGDVYHQSTSRDGWIAKEADGVTPSHLLVNAWRSVLGDSDADTRLDAADNCPLVANADQTDSDANGAGDACGPTFATGAVGGTVPATLTLTLGAAAALGAFVPGVDREYDAGTTASVTSTAGDTTLSVGDTATNATGRLVNGAASLSEPLRAAASGAGALAPLSTTGVPLSLVSYTGPVSNATVAIAFRQHIGRTEALRTGSYSKTLTFTLSTTTP